MIEQLICNEQQRAEHVSTPAQLRFSLPHEALIHFCREYRVKKLSLFGSILRNDFTPKSDIDVLIEFELGHDPTYFTVVEMEEKLSRMLGGRKIDLKTAQELSQHLRPQVLKEAEVVYAA
ncbi:MAG: nucleotidyltransferase family protein [Deltaproteobacteria bacterium]|nr:nucleotidyltransferase family protein [Deltaproteobacteria bacterium]